MNLEGTDPAAFDKAKLTPADKWILSRLAKVIERTNECLESYKFSEPINELYKFFWNDFCDWYLEWAKPRVQDSEQKDTVQNVLAFVLDQTIRLLHPFIPFITEGIFQKLNEVVPQRKLNGLAESGKTEALVISEWPRKIDVLKNDEAEADIDCIQTVTRTLRDLRSRYNVAPNKKMDASVATNVEAAEILNKNADLIRQLANLKGFDAGQSLKKPDNAAAAIVEYMQIYLHNAIDTEAELKRLTKQKEEILRAKKGVEAKLANENFVNKAKPKVVEQARQRLNELAEQLAVVENHVAQLKDKN
jgi:valyl-tRNA synthetase